MLSKTSYTIKVVDNCKIEADVYSMAGTALRPVIMWIHGGALIWGNKANIHPEQVETYTAAGFNLVAVNHRLAPKTKLASIIEDIQDAYTWIHEKGPELFHINPDRIAVIGHSAGGYLALMTGFCVKPRPAALVSFYGYGDIAGAWYSRPDAFYCRQPSVSREEAYRTVEGHAVSSTTRNSNRWLYYLYCRQNGLWPREITGHDPDTDDEFFDSYCPVRNVTSEYPPTILLHGELDTDVPYEQSVMMANKLASAKCTHELITIPGGGHVFDQDGMGEAVVADAFKSVVSFLKQHVI